MNLKKFVAATGSLAVVGTAMSLVTHATILAWLLAADGLAFIVSAMVYQAETRPRQRHEVK